MTLPGAGRTDQNGAVALGDELQGMQLETDALGDLGVVAPIELRQRGAFIEAGELVAAFEETGLPAVELILEDDREGFEEGEIGWLSAVQLCPRPSW